MSIDRIKKLWYIYKVEYYSAIKRNGFQSVELRWTTLEAFIQSEVSQKEKKKNIVYGCIYMESRKTVLTSLFSGQEERCRLKDQWHSGGRRGWDGLRAAVRHTGYHVGNRQLVGSCYVTRGAQPRAPRKLRVVGWGGWWKGGSRGSGHVYSWFKWLYGRNQHNILKKLPSS